MLWLCACSALACGSGGSPLVDADATADASRAEGGHHPDGGGLQGDSGSDDGGAGSDSGPPCGIDEAGSWSPPPECYGTDSTKCCGGGIGSATCVNGQWMCGNSPPSGCNGTPCPTDAGAD